MKPVAKAVRKNRKIDTVKWERMLMDQLPQVRYIARRIHDRLPQHVALEDLVHAGVLGLIDALNKYDPNKNVQLKSYAKFRIRGEILDSLRRLDWSPRDLRKKARYIEQVHRKLRARLGHPPSEPELAQEMGMELHEFQLLLGELRGLDRGSLHGDDAEDGREQDIAHHRPTGPEEDPFFLCLRSEMKGLLAGAIHELPSKDRQVLALYYYKELTMKEVGAVMGVGESRVSQIHSAAVVRLRSRVRNLLEERPPEKKSLTPTRVMPSP